MTDEEYLKARGWYESDKENDLWARHSWNLWGFEWSSLGSQTKIAVYTKEAALRRQLAEDKKNLKGVLEYVESH